ncbi:hypothetical protein AL755_16455 [Arthrobacter sp. ERGS1:01]|nr:hypothetical protein AL755_16455 [Arthrobacter sp. ERGS1:01]
MRTWWRKHRFWLLAGTAFVLVITVSVVLGLSGQRSGGPLAIDNPAPEGGRAAASVLRGQGVEVTATDSLEATIAALQANGPAASTVLVYDPQTLLRPTQLAELSGAATDHDAKVVGIAPGPLAVQKLSSDISSAGVAPAGAAAVQADCANPDASAAGSIDSESIDGLGTAGSGTSVFLYRGTQTCFTPDGGTAGLLASNSTGSVSVLGNAGVVSNNSLASRGNAALVFRLLGSRPQLIWYTASLKDVPVASQPPSLAELTPAWIFPASAWLLLVGVVGMLWRGRRNGPLVTEPLPVIVKASETVTGRARLYQDAKAVDTAARTLQHATLTRLARQLRLGATAGPDAVVAAVAGHTGRNGRELHQLLVAGVPRNEKEMLTMATQLAALEEEVTQR